jgi:hypothetical protein
MFPEDFRHISYLWKLNLSGHFRQKLKAGFLILTNKSGRRELSNSQQIRESSCSEKADLIYLKVKSGNHLSALAFLKYSISIDYISTNNFPAGRSFNENLLYLSPVLKKVYFY